MGQTPPGPPPKPLPRDERHLLIARRAYVSGVIDVDQFELAVEHVLRGGKLGQDATPEPPSPFPTPTMEVILKL